MRLALVPIFFVSLCTSCSAETAIDESCYFVLSSDVDELRQSGLGLGPIAEVARDLTDQYFADDRSVPPLARSGILLFAERCDLIETKNFVEEAFEGSVFRYRLRRITQSEYIHTADELGLLG